MTLQEKFEAIGGRFFTGFDSMASLFKTIDTFIFDWDGVFNSGEKKDINGSPFSEPDSMGINMLRFSYWLMHGKLPITCIMSGANNESAKYFAEREHLHAVLLNTKNKAESIQSITKKFKSSPKSTLFVFDDILDLGAASQCSLRFCINRKASPLFSEFIEKNTLCDYLSGQEGGQHAVREITELMIGLNNNFDEVVSKRMTFHPDYETYLKKRNEIESHFQR